MSIALEHGYSAGYRDVIDIDVSTSDYEHSSGAFHIYVGGTGDVRFETADGTLRDATIATAGSMIRLGDSQPILARKVVSSGTTATSISVGIVRQ